MGRAEITDEDLLKMQQASKNRHDFSGIMRKPKGLKDVLFFEGEYIPAVKMLFTKSGTLKDIRKVRRPQEKYVGKPKPTRPKMIVPPKQIVRAPVLPEVKPKPISRPPAIYDQIPSPYWYRLRAIDGTAKKENWLNYNYFVSFDKWYYLSSMLGRTW